MRAYYYRGFSYQLLENYPKAIENFNKIIEMNPNDFDAHFIRGNLYLNVNKSSEAIVDYNRAIEIKPESF